MKKLFIIGTLMMAVLATEASRTKKQKSWQPDYKLEQAFKNQFGDIGNVSWTIVSDMLTSAGFIDSTISDRPIKAFFDNEGQYLGMTQQTSIADMPERLAKKLRAMLADYTVVDVIEYWNEGSSAYYIKVINKDGSRLVKAAINAAPRFIEKIE